METNLIQRQGDTLPVPIVQEIKAIMGNIVALLPPDISLDQFRAAAWLELRGVRGIDECSGESVAAALVKAANAGLLPGRDCHIIPFTSPRNRRKEATMIPGYQGLILSLERSGKVKKAFAHAVYSRDVFEVDYLMDVFSHKPSLMGDRGKMQCVYGCILEKDGTRHFEIMTLGQVDAIKARAPGHDSGPWTTDYEEMARKTALKRVMKFVRLSPQQQQLLADDDDRERSDIPLERFRETSTDLYGEPRDIPNFAQAPTIEARKPPTPSDGTPQDDNVSNRHAAAANRHIDGVAHTTPSRSAPPQTELHGVEDDDIPPQVHGGEVFIDQINAVLRANGETDQGIETYWKSTCRRCKVSSPVAIKMAWLPRLLEERRAYYAKQEQTQQAAARLLEQEDSPSGEPAPWRTTLADAALAVPESQEALHQDIAAALMSVDTPEDVGREVLARVQELVAELAAVGEEAE